MLSSMNILLMTRPRHTSNSASFASPCRAALRSTSIPILRIKSPLPVRQHKDFFDFPAFGPLKHYKGIVDRDADDLINAQFNKFVVTPLIARQVALRHACV